MTDRGSYPSARRGRWSATLAVAPAAAAVFAATTTWSVTHDPSATPAVPASNASSTADQTAALQQTLDTQTEQVSALQAQVSQLRAETAALGQGGGSAPAANSVSAAKPGAAARPAAAAAPRSAASSTRTAPRTTVRAKAPAVHAVTGGS
ncbi:MAG TPA: hypothetical protein VFP72_10070 [Kineosporiaceae bacterium]|nr:hypothetical protein [Kineosporiaceae bacterium]